MAQITLNATAAQSVRLQEAVNSFNAANGTTLTVKQWIYRILKEAVKTELWLLSPVVDPAQFAAARTQGVAIDADMSGGT